MDFFVPTKTASSPSSSHHPTTPPLCPMCLTNTRNDDELWCAACQDGPSPVAIGATATARPSPSNTPAIQVGSFPDDQEKTAPSKKPSGSSSISSLLTAMSKRPTGKCGVCIAAYWKECNSKMHMSLLTKIQNEPRFNDTKSNLCPNQHQQPVVSEDGTSTMHPYPEPIPKDVFEDYRLAVATSNAASRTSRQTAWEYPSTTDWDA